MQTGPELCVCGHPAGGQIDADSHTMVIGVSVTAISTGNPQIIMVKRH